MKYDLNCEDFNQIWELDPDLIIWCNTFRFDYKYLTQKTDICLVIVRILNLNIVRLYK